MTILGLSSLTKIRFASACYKNNLKIFQSVIFYYCCMFAVLTLSIIVQTLSFKQAWCYLLTAYFDWLLHNQSSSNKIVLNALRTILNALRTILNALRTVLNALRTVFDEYSLWLKPKNLRKAYIHWTSFWCICLLHMLQFANTQIIKNPPLYSAFGCNHLNIYW